MKENFILPINTQKRETSYIEKMIISSENDQDNFITLPKNIHKNTPRLKFFISGFKNQDMIDPEIMYVGRWIELEPQQFFKQKQNDINSILSMNLPVQNVSPSPINSIPFAILDEIHITPVDFVYNFSIGFVFYHTNDYLRIILNLRNQENTPCKLYIEKIVIEDSEFNPDIGWTNHNDPNNILSKIGYNL